MVKYENYANLRNLKNLKDSEVARMTGIPQSTFSDWKKEKSFPKQEKLQRIADALGVSYSYLIGVEEHVYEIPQYEPAVQEIIDLLPMLSSEQIDSLLRTARIFASQNDVQ